MQKTLREWRKEKGYTTKFVADYLGLATFTLNRKERGQKSFSCYQTKRLCELYNIEYSDVKPIFLGNNATKMEQE